jgi:hypothetical protein
MDGARFDAVARSLTGAATRRGVARVVASLVAVSGLPLADLGVVQAKKKCPSKKKRCKGKCIPKKDCCRDTDCPGDRVCKSGKCIVPFCAGKNTCDEQIPFACESSGLNCFCWIKAKTGKPFCGGSAFTAKCADCAKGETCVNLDGTFCSAGTGCAAPCANPK